MGDNDGVTRRAFIGAAGGAGTMALAGCTQQNTASGSGNTTTEAGLSGNIDVKGSSTVFPLATAVKEEFEDEHSGVSISVASTGSGGGFSNHFCVGKSDFNNASRPIKEEEKQLCEDNGVEWHEIKVATDALTVVVNNDADWVDCMTVEELKQIWEPDGAEKWSDVNDDWPDEPFELYGAASTSGTFDYFTEVIVGEEGKHRQDYSATEQDRTIIQGVKGSEYAIGYLGFAYYTENTDVVKALGVDDGDGCVKPSLETAKSGEYTPLARPLFTYPSKEAMTEEHKAEFARYFVEQSTDRELVAEDVGYVPQTEENAQQELDDLNAFIEQARSG